MNAVAENGLMQEVRDRELRILMVEDSPSDERMVLWAMRHMPWRIVHRRVASEAELRDALASFSPDVILSDFTMPGFGGHEALRISSEVAPLVPFLFVSGTIGEDTAVEAMKTGAHDYIMKANLTRLAPAVARELRGCAAALRANNAYSWLSTGILRAATAG